MVSVTIALGWFFVFMIMMPLCEPFFRNNKHFFTSSSSSSRIRKNIKKVNNPVPQVLFPDPDLNHEAIKKIDGFYGLIGPDFHMNTTHSLFDLFTKNGIIHGVFFKNNSVVFAKHAIQTEKRVFEQESGHFILPNHLFFYMLTQMIQTFMKHFTNINMPNMLGVANTAIMQVKERFYALYERDQPYEIAIHFDNHTLETRGKVIAPLEHMSGHSIYNTTTNKIETIDYSMMTQSVTYFSLDPAFQIHKKKSFSFAYPPILHDFISKNERVFLLDAPFEMHPHKLFEAKVPFALNNKKKTYMHVYNTREDKTDIYTCNEGFTVFHYGYMEEDEEGYSIYASLYDTLDFHDLKIDGKYRKLVLNKTDKTMTIYRNAALEHYNLDFPVAFGEKVISRNYNKEKNRIDGFVVTDGLDIKQTFLYEDREIFGEPKVIPMSDNVDNAYLCFFNKYTGQEGKEVYAISLLHLGSGSITDFILDEEVRLGFHSIYVSNPSSKV